MKHKNPKTKEKGQSLVELAMSLVMLLTLLAGVVDFGRAFFTWITLRDAAQEGASYASVIRTTKINDVSEFCDDITARVEVTTTDLSGGVTSTPINLLALAEDEELTVNTTIISKTEIITDTFNIEFIPCEDAEPEDICHGNEIRVEVNYGNFPLTMPFIGTILGSQQIPLRASVRDTILTPACTYDVEE